jgi:hypothetical protein
MQRLESKDYSRLVTSQFYHDLAQACNLIHAREPDLPLPERILIAVRTEPNQSHLALAIHAWVLQSIATQRSADLPQYIRLLEQAKPVMTQDFLNWLVPFLAPVLGQLEIPQSSDACFNYKHHTQSGAAWNNLLVPANRRQRLQQFADSLISSFPHWQPVALRFFLSRLPCFSLLERELNKTTLAVCSKITPEFVEAFLRSTYIMHLGFDPLPQDFAAAPQLFVAAPQLQAKPFLELVKAMRSHRPRYRVDTHEDLFARLRRQPPFSREYAKVFEQLLPTVDEKILSDLLATITFRLSMPHAHSIMRSREFLEWEAQLKPSEAYEKRIAWRLEYYRYFLAFGGVTPAFLEGIAPFIPTVLELLTYDLAGTHAYRQSIVDCTDENRMITEAAILINSEAAFIRADFGEVPLRRWFDKGHSEWIDDPEEYVRALRHTILIMHELAHLLYDQEH